MVRKIHLEKQGGAELEALMKSNTDILLINESGIVRAAMSEVMPKSLSLKVSIHGSQSDDAQKDYFSKKGLCHFCGPLTCTKKGVCVKGLAEVPPGFSWNLSQLAVVNDKLVFALKEIKKAGDKDEKEKFEGSTKASSSRGRRRSSTPASESSCVVSEAEDEEYCESSDSSDDEEVYPCHTVQVEEVIVPDVVTPPPIFL